MRGPLILAVILAALMYYPLLASAMPPIYDPEQYPLLGHPNATWTYIDNCVDGKPCVVVELGEEGFSLLVVVDRGYTDRVQETQAYSTEPALPPDIALQLRKGNASELGGDAGKVEVIAVGALILVLPVLFTARRLVSP